MKPDTVGLIGLGLVGSAIATRLFSHGITVVGYDLNASARDRFSYLGGNIVSTATEVADNGNPVLLSLPDSDVVETVLKEIGTSLTPGHVIIDTTTGDPVCTEALAQNLAEKGVTYLDATISGSSEQIRQQEVIITVGGSKAAFESYKTLLNLFCKECFHVGPAGSGAKMKLISNLVLGLNRAVLAEALAFTKRFGLDLEQVLTILKKSPAYSCAMDVKGEKMVNEDFAPQARLSQHRKDVDLMLQAAEKVGAKLPFTKVHRELLSDAEVHGLGEYDNSAILRMFQTTDEEQDDAQGVT